MQENREECQKVKLSIIMPAYNSESTIQKAISSIMEQTEHSLELLVIDDCSVDNTQNIVLRMAESDDRIRYYKQDKNQGPGAAKNRGIELAKGEYIGFCDSDDWIEKKMYQHLYESAKNEDADVAICGYSQDMVKNDTNKVINTNLVHMETCVAKNEEIIGLIAKLDEKKLFSFACNKIYRNSILKNNKVYFSDLLFGEDYEFNVLFFRYVFVMTVCNETYYHYVKHNSDSLTERFIPDFYEIIKERYRKMQELLSIRGGNGLNDVKGSIASVHLKHVMASMIRNCDPRSGYSMLERRKVIYKELSDATTRSACNDATSNSYTSYIYSWIIKTNNVTLNQLFARFVYFVQNNLKVVFERIKGI